MVNEGLNKSINDNGLSQRSLLSFPKKMRTSEIFHITALEIVLILYTCV